MEDHDTVSGKTQVLVTSHTKPMVMANEEEEFVGAKEIVF